MPSALSWFRKNQKIMLGFFSVGLMFIFTFSLGVGVDPIMDRLSGRSSGGPTSETVVTWDDGQLDSRQLDRLRVNRNLLRRFMGSVMQLARQRGGQQRVAMLQLYSGDRSLLELEMLVREAEKMGIEVNDATVLDYLNQLTDGTIPAAEYQRILLDSTGNHLPANSLFPLLARELKAQKVRGLVQSGNFPASPIAAWDYYNRLNRLVQAEIMPIEAADYIDQVPEPTETEVTELFEKYKKFYPMPLSPEPGFRQREKRAFQYVKVNYDAILEVERGAVTDAEIKAYYDENRESYVESDDDPLGLDPSSTDTTAAPENGSDVEGDESDAAESDTGESDTGEAVGSAPADTDTDTDDKAGTAGTAGAESAEPGEAKADGGEKDASEAADQAAAADDTKEANPTPSPTALPEDEEGKDEEGKDAKADGDEADGDEAEASEAEKEKDPSDAADAPVANDEATASDEAADENEAADKDEASASDDASASGGEAESDAEDGAKEAQPEGASTDPVDTSDLDDIASYRPLSEVADEIRQSIAAPKAQVKMKELLDRVQRDMERYSQDRTLWEMDREDDPDLPPPPMPDFAEVVDGTQAVLGKIGLTNRIEIADFEIGQAFDIAIYGRQNVQRILFSDVAYQPNLTPFRPNLFPKLDMATDRYVYWLTDVAEEYIPELDEVRTQVVETWKQGRALELAQADAATLVEKARQAGTTLQQSLSSDRHTQFINTGEVSWVTAPFQEGATPTISPINGAEDAGPEMRARLFRLPPGGIDFAPNMPKNKVYVFRVEAESPDVEVRREQFLKEGVDAPILFLARRDSMVGLTEWYRELTDRHGVDWQRDPQVGDNGEQ